MLRPVRYGARTVINRVFSSPKPQKKMAAFAPATASVPPSPPVGDAFGLFPCKFLGSAPVSAPSGDAAIQAAAVAVNEAKKAPLKVLLAVAPSGMHLRDPADKRTLTFVPLASISYANLLAEKFLCYIVVERRAFFCFVFAIEPGKGHQAMDAIQQAFAAFNDKMPPVDAQDPRRRTMTQTPRMAGGPPPGAPTMTLAPPPGQAPAHHPSSAQATIMVRPLAPPRPQGRAHALTALGCARVGWCFAARGAGPAKPHAYHVDGRRDARLH